MKTIVLDPAAAKQLDALPADAREAITEALARYAVTGYGDVVNLKDRSGFRLRVGAYRVMFLSGAETIEVVYIGRRSTTTYR